MHENIAGNVVDSMANGSLSSQGTMVRRVFSMFFTILNYIKTNLYSNYTKKYSNDSQRVDSSYFVRIYVFSHRYSLNELNVNNITYETFPFHLHAVHTECYLRSNSLLAHRAPILYLCDFDVYRMSSAVKGQSIVQLYLSKKRERNYS